MDVGKSIKESREVLSREISEVWSVMSRGKDLEFSEEVGLDFQSRGGMWRKMEVERRIEGSRGRLYRKVVLEDLLSVCYCKLYCLN